jgi:hypothetical protein
VFRIRFVSFRSQILNLNRPEDLIRIYYKSRRMRWTGHVASMGEMRNAYKFWLGNLKGRDHSEDFGVLGNIY